MHIIKKGLIFTRVHKRFFAAVLILLMVLPLVPITAAAAPQLDTPTLIAKGSAAPGGNPAQHTQFRSLVFEPISGATGYNVVAYATKADAEGDANRVAIAKNVQPTITSQTTGGTMGTPTFQLTGTQKAIDVRLIQFEDVKPGATRDLPVGYTPAGLGDTYFPGDGTGDKTNLKPGQYWFRLQAVDAADPTADSGLSAIYADGDAFSIATGPDEARDLLEPLLAAGKLGTTADADFRIVDLRANPEFGDEGYIRFSAGNRYAADAFNTTAKAEAIFGHVADKSAVTIFVF
jgi:hypothetical protein